MAGAVAASGCRPCRKRLAALTKPGPNGEPTTTDTGPRQATSSHGHGWQMARRATSSDGNDSSYKRGVTGSIPVAPTRAKRSCFHLRILPMGAQVGAGFPGALPERGQPPVEGGHGRPWLGAAGDRKSTRLNSSHVEISYAVFCLKKKKKIQGMTLRTTTNVTNNTEHFLITSL